MKRSELYDKVWSMPVIKVGQELGLSGTRIATICRQHGIPTPGRGHWAKLSVGKQPRAMPLPQPEADYEIKVGGPQPRPRPSAWIAPGVLLRPETDSDQPQQAAPNDIDEPLPLPPQAHKSRRQGEGSERHLPHVDLEFVRAAAAELQHVMAIRELLQAVSSRAIHALPEENCRILNWAASVREKLDAQDPVAALLRLTLTSHLHLNLGG